METSLSYLPHLDALRALAVGLVFIWHWWPSDSVINRIPNGALGVVLFFVLSGFLITRILLVQRDGAEKASVSRFHVYRQFFLRRALRIFPIYYLTLGFVGFVWVTPDFMSEHLAYFFTYSANVMFALHGWGWSSAQHLWSLCVEEQFYLFWPLAVLFLPRTWLPRLFVLVAVLAVVVRIAGRHLPLIEALMPSCLDSFGLGAGLAYVWVRRPDRVAFFTACAGYGALLLAVAAAGGLAGPRIAWERVLMSLASTWLVGRAARGFRGRGARVAAAKPLVFMGKISYGLYLFHYFVPPYYHEIHLASVRLDLRWPGTHWILVPEFGREAMFPVWLACLVLVASISWFGVERPLSALRLRVGYLG